MPQSTHEVILQTPSLAGRVAVVTGGTSALGAATASILRRAGAQVALIDDDAHALSVVGALVDAHTFVANLVDGPDTEQAFDDIKGMLGCVSILVNCAEAEESRAVVQLGLAMPLDAFRRLIEANLLSAINCIRCAVPQMIEGRSSLADEAGVIVNTASIAASDGQAGQVAYAASKGGVAGMVLPLARELGEHGIRVMGIAPGAFEAQMKTQTSVPSLEGFTPAPMPPFPQRPGRADEFAALVLAIVGNTMLNGEVIRLDGGLRMPAGLSRDKESE